MTQPGITLDTGALIAMERRKRRGLNLLQFGEEGGARLSAPTAVVAEWWRGRTDWRDQILEVVEVEPVSLSIAKSAGEALAAVANATAVDAIVMAFAAARGDSVFTTDVEDLMRLQQHFPGVRVLAV